ncbi:tyrosine-protein phosphatase [Cryobacterium melibiosiphilum]|uniref:Tyrosine-protein phosphatase n=1 Tax=Cryobacterium melibiosiphilum TaxID=995039 RepID=A0A3A5MTU3_9MICO|nr:tyrosine-protein phosphatase [Cryobacterium melibiosiphilum]RJT88644.1 tyrosine-protein phosphatase [Cryobacterium melibiosiphilum]RJT89406.1 tyrosine-protein phosphatase [Cryobacterium melibiosiphilum]
MTILSVPGTYNVRGIGSAASPWLLRSATLDAITEAGASVLARLKVALVLDLRDSGERGVVRHPIPVHHLPIFEATDAAPHGQSPVSPVSPYGETLEEIYETILYARAAQLTQAVAVVADTPGTVLVHCAAGKDRTGLVVALTLLAAGAAPDDVVDDYARSTTEVRLFRRDLADAALRELPLTEEEYEAALSLHLDSPADALRHVLTVLDRFGGVEAYLVRGGLTIDQFHALRERYAASLGTDPDTALD